MKIALVGLTYPFRGGIAHYTTLLCRALRKRHEVEFCALSRQYPSLLFPGKTQRDTSQSTLDVASTPCLDSINPLSWRSTADRIGRFGADLVLFSWWHPFFAPSFGTVARRSRRRYSIPSCFLCHNVVPHEHSRVDRMLSRYAFGSAAAFITHSQEDADNLRDLLPNPVVHRNPHPTYDAFSPKSRPSAARARGELGIAEDRRVLLFFGYVRRYKGLEYLLDAVSRLEDSRYHLVVVGEFYEPRERFADRIDPLQASGRLTLVDRYVPNEEIPLYFSAADVVVVPYLTATQSGIVQMAYGFGRPVIATAVGGLPEAVIDGETGHLVPPGDVDALASTIERHFEHGDEARYRAAIEREGHKYSWERMVETVEAVAEKLR